MNANKMKAYLGLLISARSKYCQKYYTTQWRAVDNTAGRTSRQRYYEYYEDIDESNAIATTNVKETRYKQKSTDARRDGQLWCTRSYWVGYNGPHMGRDIETAQEPEVILHVLAKYFYKKKLILRCMSHKKDRTHTWLCCGCPLIYQFSK